jgi:hypothetical protein
MQPTTDQEIIRATRTLMSAHSSVVSAGRMTGPESGPALSKARQEYLRVKRQWSELTGVPL